MNRTEKATYLANVLSIASADGSVGAEETLALRHIASKLGADGALLDEAKQMITGGTYRLTLPPSQASRMGNIEDMILVALADNKLKDEEIKPIEAVAGALRLAQADVDMLVARARGQLHKLKQRAGAAARPATVFDSPGEGRQAQRSEHVTQRRPAQPSEHATQRRSARRSQDAGVRRRAAEMDRQKQRRPVERVAPEEASTGPAPPLAAKQPPSEPPREPRRPSPPPSAPASQSAEPAGLTAGPGITLAFTGEPGDGLDACVALAQSAPDSGKHDSGGVQWHYARWPAESSADAVPLAMSVIRLPHYKLYVDGKATPWEHLFAFCPCAAQRAAGEHPREHCYGLDAAALNPWGCALLALDWTVSAEWLRLGAFEDDYCFRVDREALGELLTERLDRVRLCPHLQPALATTALALLPERVHTWGGWGIQEAEEGGGDGQRISVTEDLHGCTISATKWARGISPRSARRAIRLIKSAARKCGVPEPNYLLLSRKGRQGLASNPAAG